MKRNLLVILLVFSCMTTAIGQEIRVIEQKQLTTQAEGQFFFPKFSPDGNSILITSENYKGLKVRDLKTKKTLSLSEAEGAGYEPVFSPDGEKVYFRENITNDLKKYSNLNEFRILKKKNVVLEKKKRNVSTAQIVNNQLVYSIDNSPKKSKISGTKTLKSAQSEIYISNENLKIVLYQNGTRKMLPLNGDGNYIWASLSPNRQKILYNYNGKSTYIADLEGNVLVNLGKLNAPKWINNNWVVGMNDQDNGHEVISSDILAVSADGKTKSNLTSTSDQIEMYPEVSATGDQVIFHTTKGEIFSLKLKVN